MFTVIAGFTALRSFWINHQRSPYHGVDPNIRHPRNSLQLQQIFPLMVDMLNSTHSTHRGKPLKIAIVGTGISGMSAAWLLSQHHNVTVFEKAERLGGHSNTVNVGSASGDTSVDTGFIVYNEPSYPNLTALFKHLGVATQPSNMSFSVSLDDGGMEYAATDFRGLFAQPSNALSPRFWSMAKDLLRFYREATVDAGRLDTLAGQSLGDYLEQGRYGKPFIHDHLLPMAAAIWSAPGQKLLDYPVTAFIRFCNNHGLLKLTGSTEYVKRLSAQYANRIRFAEGARSVIRSETGVAVLSGKVSAEMFDHVVIATHADEALAMLDQPSVAEQRCLGAFGYERNVAVLHSDAALMPRRKAAWASWNYLGSSSPGSSDGAAPAALSLTYWMNRLQDLPAQTPYFVTLNPAQMPDAARTWHQEVYEHPIFNHAALTAQNRLWSLQGKQRTWFCGAYFGAGFHEDGLQAGLAVAEALGGVKRPWQVANESGRIVLGTIAKTPLSQLTEAVA
jgi:uncharacterized protein